MCSSWPGRTARMCVPAEPERACMMWYRAVAHVSLYFFCPPSLAPRRPPVAVAAHPKSSPPSGGITRVSHYPQRPSVRQSASPAVRSRHDRSTEMEVVAARARWAPTLATSSVRLHVVWLRRHHFVFSVVHRCRRCAIAQGAPPRSRPNMCRTIILMTQSSLVASKKNWARHGTVTRPPKFSRSASTRIPNCVPVWPGTAWNVPIVV